MIDTYNPHLESLGPIAAFVEKQPETAVVLAAVVDGKQVGISIYDNIGEDHASHPGWYITHVFVHPDHQGEGLGYTLVSEALRRIGKGPVYLVRPATEGRVFQGGFGFKPVAGEYHLEGFNPSLALFVAKKPDPDWTR